MIGGVCAGIADAYAWDPVWVRVGAVLLFFLGHISVVIAYVVAWVVMPNEPVMWAAPGMPGTPGYAGGVPPAGEAAGFSGGAPTS